MGREYRVRTDSAEVKKEKEAAVKMEAGAVSFAALHSLHERKCMGREYRVRTDSAEVKKEKEAAVEMEA
eukprot:gene31405-6571_t